MTISYALGMLATGLVAIFIALRKLPLAIETQPKQWKTADWPDLRNMEIFK